MRLMTWFRASTWVTLCFVATVSLSVNAHKLADDASAEERAFVYRDSLFHVLGWKTTILFDMAKGNRAQDPALFAATAREIAMLAPFIPEGFIPNSVVEESLALPEIWENFDDFKEKASDLEKAALNLADVAEKDYKKATGMLRKFAGNCGGCHREYKVDED